MIQWPPKCWKLYVENCRPNHSNNYDIYKFEFLDPNNVENDILWKTVGQTIQIIFFQLSKSAIFNFKVKNRSNHQNNTISEFLDPNNAKNDILCKSVGQTIQKMIFKIVKVGHFGFAALTDSARTFAMDMGAKFFIYTIKKSNQH